MFECEECNNQDPYCSVCAVEKTALNFVSESNPNDFYSFNMIKARIAETLIQELFISQGYSVYKYGMENTIPGIMKQLIGLEDDIAHHIRRMPDFVIQNQKSRELFFIEVKFRANGEFSEANLDANYPYNNAHIILVSKKHIKCITVKELRDGKCLTSECRSFLGNRKEFELDNLIVGRFCKYAETFFDKV